MSENEELVTAATYGRIIGFSRQAIVNDDLGALENVASTAGQRLADFENALFFTTCIAPNSGMGPALKDTYYVFDSTHHKNATGSGALSNTLLASARSLLMQMTSLDGLKLNIVGRTVLVSPDSLSLAESLLVSQGYFPSTNAGVNIFAGKIEAVGDANLSGTRFYVLADPARVPCFVYGYLQGFNGPHVTTGVPFESDGINLKVSLDFGCGAIDYRGAATGAGV
jgi:hypothetical protein